MAPGVGGRGSFLPFLLLFSWVIFDSPASLFYPETLQCWDLNSSSLADSVGSFIIDLTVQ